MSKIRTWAIAKKAVCLDDFYENSKKKMRFQCLIDSSHIFEISYNKFSNLEVWCQKCKEDDAAKIWVNKLNLCVAKRGGVVVSCEVNSSMRIGSDTRVRIKCGVSNHPAWEPKVGDLCTAQKWCPECAKTTHGERLTIEKIRAIAKSRGGECLSFGFRNCRSQVRMVCKEKHEWATTPFSLNYQNSWCPRCSFDENFLTPKQKLDGWNKLKSFVVEKGGECLSEIEYTGVNGMCRIKCGFSHAAWTAKVANIIYNESWCPQCAGGIGEKLTGEYISRKTGFVFEKIRPRWLGGFGVHCLELDFYSHELALGVEYQGQQHYQFMPMWHVDEQGFGRSVERDERKRKLCAAHGVILLEVPFVVKPTKDRIEKQIEACAAAACLPFDINPEYRAFMVEMAEIHEWHKANGTPDLALEACRKKAKALATTEGLGGNFLIE